MPLQLSQSATRTGPLLLEVLHSDGENSTCHWFSGFHVLIVDKARRDDLETRTASPASHGAQMTGSSSSPSTSGRGAPQAAAPGDGRSTAPAARRLAPPGRVHPAVEYGEHRPPAFARSKLAIAGLSATSAPTPSRCAVPSALALQSPVPPLHGRVPGCTAGFLAVVGTVVAGLAGTVTGRQQLTSRMLRYRLILVGTTLGLYTTGTGFIPVPSPLVAVFGPPKRQPLQ